MTAKSTFIYTIGVDIAQAECVWAAYHHPTQTFLARGTVARTQEALGAWAAELQRQWPQALVVLEATGGLERAVRRALQEVGLAVAIANPKRVQRMREAGGKAKTDRLDAETLALWGALYGRPQPPVSLAEERMRDLLLRREQVQAMVHQERMRLRQAQDAFVRAQIQAVIQLLEKQKAELEAEIRRQWQRWQEEVPQVADDVALLMSLPGVGFQTALELRVWMPELGTLRAKEVGALSGTAPQARDSGKRRGRRRIRDGRRRVRGALYMTVLTVLRRKEGPLWAFYQRLRQRGKPFYVAATALIRKILVIANAMLRDRRPWNPPQAQTRFRFHPVSPLTTS